MNILSIQSHVAFGHVGNSASVFALQRLGHEAWPVNTVQFSNHPGHGGFRGEVFSARHVAEVLEGLGERGLLARCDILLTGYLGRPENGEAALRALAKARAANPGVIYACDPVTGDNGRIYVASGLAEFFREQALPAATLMTPNAFELSLLSGIEPASLAEARAAISALLKRGPGAALVTSIILNETRADSIDILAGDSSGLWRLSTPRLSNLPNGAGDLIAALFTAHWRESRSTPEALSRAASSVYGILRRTVDAGAREMLLIEAQEELLNPGRLFRAERV